MASYTVRGSLKDYNGEPFLIQVWDDDERLLDDRVNDLLASTFVRKDGTFEVSFSDKPASEFFEGRPDLFVIVRDKTGKIIHRTETRGGVSPKDTQRLTFSNLPTTRTLKPKDPYGNNTQRSIGAFQRIGETVNPTENVQRTLGFLLQTLQAWTIYTNEKAWNKIRYDGPQVDRYPWRKMPHPHTLDWEK
jgi:hypothetical protein